MTSMSTPSRSIATTAMFALATVCACCPNTAAGSSVSKTPASEVDGSAEQNVDETARSADLATGMAASDSEATKPACDHLTEMWDFSQPQKSAERFAAAARDSAAAGDTPCELEALTQLARAQGLQGNFDDAHLTLDQVDRRLGGAAPGRPGLRSKLERGRVLNSSKQPGAAFPLFVESWQLAGELGEDGLAVDAAHMVAIARIKEPDLALEWNLRALELAQSSDAADARRWLGSLYNNIAWTYFDRGDYERALGIFQKGVEFREQEGKPKPLLIAKWTVARALRALERTEEALAAQQQLVEEYEGYGLEPTGFVYEELAECKLELGQPGYRELFARAHAALSKDEWLVDNEPERLERLLRLSKP